MFLIFMVHTKNTLSSREQNGILCQLRGIHYSENYDYSISLIIDVHFSDVEMKKLLDWEN